VITENKPLVSDHSAYEQQMHAWRRTMEDKIRAEDGWLAFAGLFWLSEGVNTVGSDPSADVVLPSSAPAQLGTLTLDRGRVRLSVTADIPVEVEGQPTREADLRDDQTVEGETRVRLGAVTFFVVRRKDKTGIRVLDVNSSIRLNFQGRHWFPLNADLRFPSRFLPYQTPRVVDVLTSYGVLTPIPLVGTVEFEAGGQRYTLEAFDGGEGKLWFVFKDATNGAETYGGGRFLYASLPADGDERVVLDFNQAYLPACAFTPYAMCPLPPQGNILPFRVEAGERLPPA